MHRCDFFTPLCEVLGSPKGGRGGSCPPKPHPLDLPLKNVSYFRFDSTLAPLLYADQYLQLSTVVPSGFLYGLGEHRSALYHNTSIWQQVALWARDQPPGVRGLYSHSLFLFIFNCIYSLVRQFISSPPPHTHILAKFRVLE